MTRPLVLTLLGIGFGALLVMERRSDPRAMATLREQVLEAQRLSARASEHARELAARWQAEDAATRASEDGR